MSHNQLRTGHIGKSPVYVGRYTYGFENIQIRQWNEGAALQIGSFCSIARDVTIFLGGNHRIDWITTFPFGHIYQDELGGTEIKGHPATKGDVVIGDDVWIGTGVTILSGVTIGSGAVLSANATVTKDVEPYQIVAGNPARAIKPRFDKSIVDLLLELKWWELSLEKIKAVAPVLCSCPSEEKLIELIKLKTDG